MFPDPRLSSRRVAARLSSCAQPVLDRCCVVLALAALLATLASPARSLAPREIAPPTDPLRRAELALRHLDATARVLYVTAHPDDEDSGLLARLHFGDGALVRLLTLTRGEGGQNEIGPELFDALGVLRSRELEGSARWLGNEQRFARAFEFGYSFSVEETYASWGEETIVREIVREIREFRPDVVLTMVPDGPGGGQHHQASARLARDAVEVAASPRWSDLGTPWRTSRVFHQVWDAEDRAVHVDLDLGIYDPLLQATYQEYGLRARASHQCQGMAQLHDPFAADRSRWRWILEADDDGFAIPPADARLPSFFYGLGTRCAEKSDAASRAIAARVDSLRAVWGTLEATGRAALLAELWTVSADLPEPDAEIVRTRIGRALGGAIGLSLEARSPARFVAAGDSLAIVVSAASAAPARIELAWDFPAPIDAGRAALLDLRAGDVARHEQGWVHPRTMEPTIARPVPRKGDSGPAQPGAFSSPRWSAFHVSPVWVEGETRIPLDPVPVLHQDVDPLHPRLFEADLHVVPEPSVRPLAERIAAPHAPGDAAAVECTWLVSSLSGGEVEVVLDAPPGWRADPPSLRARLPVGIEVPMTFRVRHVDGASTERPGVDETGTRNVRPTGGEPESFVIEARARHLETGAISGSGVQRVDYPHVRPGALQVEARAEIVPFPCRSEAERTIAYIEGAGDETREAIERLGYAVASLDRVDLLEGDLDRFDVIVTGIRAYRTRDDLIAAQPRLLEWVERGGVLLVQYNKFELNGGDAGADPFVPFPGAMVGSRRVTAEDSPVRIRHPGHAVFRHPNPLGAEDWNGWVQERGLYFLDASGDRYVDLLELEDPWPYNAGPKGGALVDAPVGAGHWIYIGLGLFRQLPHAVPGAYRILANLIALGGKETP